MKTIAEYVSLITKKYRDAKESRLSRFSVSWGEWSAPMNRELKARIESNDPQAFYLKHVFQLWIILSKLLELDRKNFIKRWAQSRSLTDELTLVTAVLAEGIKNEGCRCCAAEHLYSGGVHSEAIGAGFRLS